MLHRDVFYQNPISSKTKLIFSILLAFISPLLVVLGIFLLSCRYFVQLCAKLWRKDLICLVEPRSAFLAIDDIHSCPKGNVVLVLPLDGVLETSDIKYELERNLRKVRKDKDYEGYSRLCQYVSWWNGYAFWKHDDSFSVENHIVELKESIGAQAGDLRIETLVSQLLKQPWKRQRPLWELICVQNCPEGSEDPSCNSKTTVLFRFHHLLGDALSIRDFLAKFIFVDGIVTSQKVEKLTLREPKRNKSFIQEIKKILSMIMMIPNLFWEAAEAILAQFDHHIGFLGFQSRNNRHSQQAEYIGNDLSLGTTVAVPVDVIKKVKSTYGTSFAAVLIASLTAAIRQFLVNHDLEIPPYRNCLIPVPFKGRPDGRLINYVCAIQPRLPLAESDSLKQLRICDKHLNAAKVSSHPLLTFYGWTMMGSCPRKILRWFWENADALGSSIIMLGKDSLEFRGIKCTDYFSYAGNQMYRMGFAFIIDTYGDKVHATISAHAQRLSLEDIGEIGNLWSDHINKLYESAVNCQL